MTGRRRWDLVTWLLVAVGVIGILLLIVMLAYPILLAPTCEPIFPDLQLPTLGVEP